MTNMPLTLADYGWSNHFQSQLDPDDYDDFRPVRVMAVHRDELDVAGPDYVGRISQIRAEQEVDRATVGDWLLISADRHVPKRVLTRTSVFKRRAAGTARRVQLIAANVDTLLIVSSCNQDFNIARLERYLALASAAGVMPVVVLTRADLTEDAAAFVAPATRLMPGLLVECLDARSSDEAGRLSVWCGRGQTVALVGSSGVGKSTLINTLSGNPQQETAPIREDDAHGRHTTTGRSLHRLAAGGWLLDTPGMRELQLADVEGGLRDVFADVAAVAAECRFVDCQHDTEPGCAVREALEKGELDSERLRRFRKLASEEQRNSEDLRQRRARERGFGRMVRDVQKAKKMRQRK